MSPNRGDMHHRVLMETRLYARIVVSVPNGVTRLISITLYRDDIFVRLMTLNQGPPFSIISD
jgi:hypothetical protein